MKERKSNEFAGKTKKKIERGEAICPELQFVIIYDA